MHHLFAPSFVVPVIMLILMLFIWRELRRY